MSCSGARSKARAATPATPRLRHWLRIHAADAVMFTFVCVQNAVV